MGKLVVWQIVQLRTPSCVNDTILLTWYLRKLIWQLFQASSNLIEGYGKAHIMLSNGTILTIKEALYSPRSGRMLLSFRDIRDNHYHIETTEDNGSKFVCITSYEYGPKRIH